MTCESGTLATTLLMISWMFRSFRRHCLGARRAPPRSRCSPLREPPANVLDVLMHAEDLLDDEDQRERPALRRHRAVGGISPSWTRDLHLTGGESRCCRW